MIGRKKYSKADTVKIVLYILMTILIIIALAPTLWMVSTSLKTEPELFILPPPLLPKSLYLENYPQAFQRIPYLRMLWNSIFVATVVTIGRVLTSTFAGFTSRCTTPFVCA